MLLAISFFTTMQFMALALSALNPNPMQAEVAWTIAICTFAAVPNVALLIRSQRFGTKGPIISGACCLLTAALLYWRVFW